MHTQHHILQHTCQIENITCLSPRNGRHPSVNADLCYEPKREGHWMRGRRSPAPGGREGLKEIVRGRDGGGGLKWTAKKCRTEKDKDEERFEQTELFLLLSLWKESRCSCWSVRSSAHVPGCRTGRSPSGAGSWDRAFVWRSHLWTHNSATMAVSFRACLNTLCALHSWV